MLNKLFQGIGRLRLPLWIRGRTLVEVGELTALDAMGSTRWRQLTKPEPLFDVWGPVKGSRWEPFHCPTLFAALDQIPADKVGSAPEKWFPAWLRAGLPVPPWLDPRTWFILDAPGHISVAIAAQLATHHAGQTVCTFDNWPHPKGLVKPEMVLAALIRYATSMQVARGRWNAGMPPIWICDSSRLGRGPGRPRDFDNRYFLDDSLLPGPDLLKQGGIQQVIYGSLQLNDPPTADMIDYLRWLMQQGLSVARVAMDSMASWRASPMPVRELPRLPFKKSGFFRSTAGGFGAPIPEPSSSSG